MISDNKAQTLKQTMATLMSNYKISFNEYQQVINMIEQDNPALNTIINFFKLNTDEEELLNNLKMLLSQYQENSTQNSQNRPGSSQNNNRCNNRPMTSKVHNRIFETDSNFESDQNSTSCKKDQNRFFAIMDEIENKHLITEGEKIGVLKTLILEENKGIFSIIESQAEGNQNLIELARKLELIAKQKLEFFNDRPKTPNERKSELYLKLTNLFNDKYLSDTEINVLHRLIEEENEFVISAFDVYESDSNLKELVDTLSKIVNKAMTQKLNQKSNIARLISKKDNDEFNEINNGGGNMYYNNDINYKYNIGKTDNNFNSN